MGRTAGESMAQLEPEVSREKALAVSYEVQRSEMTPAKTFVPSDLRRCRPSRLFCPSGAFVPNGAIRQYGHNCQPPVAAVGVSPLLHHNGKIHPRRFLLLAHPNAMWQRLDFALRARALLPQIYTASYSCRDGGGWKSWKTTEGEEYM